MKCKNCHAIIPDDSQFCPFCGNKVEAPSAQDKRSVNESVIDELQGKFAVGLVDITPAYNALSSDQKARFFPGRPYQARKVIYSFLALLGQNCDYSRLLELYITIASRAMMGFETERIIITVKARFSDILPERIAPILIECAKRIYSNYVFYTKADTPEYSTYEKQFDQQYSASLIENERHENDAIRLPDFGTSVRNPIYAHAAGGSYRYLNLLYTSDLVPLTWNRVRSIAVNSTSDPIDQYDLLLPDGTKYKTVFINMYSRKSSCYYPKGLFGSGLQATDGKADSLRQPVAQEKRATPATRETVDQQGDGGKAEKRRENNRGQIETKTIAGNTPVLSEEVLSENTTAVLQGGLPVILVKKDIIKRSNNQVHAVCVFQPVTEKPIRAMQVDVLCYDVWHEGVQSVTGFQYNDLKTSRDGNIGADIVIPLPDSNTRDIDVTVQRIMLADGTLIQRSGESIQLPDLEILDKHLANIDLIHEYKRLTYKNVKYTPVKAGDIWRCTCGAVNRNDESSCHKCKDSAEVLFSNLNTEALQNSIDERKRLQKEKEEKDRIAREAAQKKAEEEREARKREAEKAAEAYLAQKRIHNKRIAIACIVIGIVGLILSITWWKIIPSIKYKQADALLASGDREAAYTAFLDDARYEDSAERAYAIKYEDAMAALDAGDYDQAIEYFKSIPDYKDSAALLKKAIYQKATQLMGEKNYSEAAELFESISGYQDSRGWGIRCRNEQTYIEGKALFEARDYKKAGEAFEAISTYLDSAELMRQSFYLHAQELIEKKQPHEAFLILNTKINQGSEPYEDSVDLANTLEYQYAMDCFDEGKYSDAAESFSNIENYKDSATRALEAEYQYGLTLISKGKYSDAEKVFTELGNYKDSAKQINESIYQHGVSLLEEKDYLKAIHYFEKLTNYRDSATKQKEALYQIGLSLLDDEQYQDAEKIFEELGYYSDSQIQLKEAE